MNIIETVQQILQSFPKINEVCNEIHIDFADTEPTSYGLSSIGDTLLKEDILGNQTRQHTFMLYSTFSGISDYERLNNSGALLELSLWLSRIAEKANDVVNNTLRDLGKYRLSQIKDYTLAELQHLNLPSTLVTSQIDGEIFMGKITKITVENGMLYSVPQENTIDGMQYQVQIVIEYTVEI